jgi:hypothetical protein
MSLKKDRNGSSEPDFSVCDTQATPPTKKDKRQWTAEEDEALMLAVLDIKQKKGFDENEEDDQDWEEIAESVPDRTAFQCYQRYVRFLHKPTSSVTEDATGTEENHITDKKEDKMTRIGKMSMRGKAGNVKDDEDYEDHPDPGKRKRGGSDSSSTKKSSPKESISSKKKAVQFDPSSRDASPSKWSAEETQMLKKLVEQYQDGMFSTWSLFHIPT